MSHQETASTTLRLKAFQARLELLNSILDDNSHLVLTQLMEQLLNSPFPPTAQLEAIESARPVLAALQREMSNRYAAHPLPPDSTENTTLRRVAGLWMSTARIYSRLDRIAREGGPLTPHRPLLAQRRIHYISRVIGEFFRAHRAVPEDAWLALHSAYLDTENEGLAALSAVDSLNDSWQAQSPAEAYVACLLVDLANPFGRNSKEFDWIWRWAQGFAPYCSLGALEEAGELGGYCVDPATGNGLRPVEATPPGRLVRHFQAKTLAGRIRGLLEQLKAGATPASLGLGEDCTQPTCSRLLVSLYRPWGLAAASRRFPRRTAAGLCLLSTDWANIASYVEMADGDQAAETLLKTAKGHLESWEIVDQSVSGFRLRRTGPGQRVEYHQLVGVRPHDGNHFLLGQVSWLMYQADGVLQAGIQLLPGLPEVVHVRSARPGAWPEAGAPLAFALPAVPAIHAEESLVLSSGWYRQDREIIVQTDETIRNVKLNARLNGGSNFDQVSYVPVLPETTLSWPGSAR